MPATCTTRRHYLSYTSRPICLCWTMSRSRWVSSGPVTGHSIFRLGWAPIYRHGRRRRFRAGLLGPIRARLGRQRGSTDFEFYWNGKWFHWLLDHINVTNVALQAAFHDSFEESREKSLQKAFDTGYELIYKHFQAVSILEGIYE